MGCMGKDKVTGGKESREMRQEFREMGVRKIIYVKPLRPKTSAGL